MADINIKRLFQEIVFEDVVCNPLTFLFRSQSVLTVGQSDIRLLYYHIYPFSNKKDKN